ncbi:hypothetical protein V8G54_015945 [Vigna mungo]|uniref:adenine phosphoribosyltransferase n=1 Tax=Vigna mungo TaxID=3915 RepID=A0AAQ3NJD9_VIGMU
MSAYKDQDPRLHGIKTKIRVVPNFPKSGIMFQDITTLLLDPKAFKDTIDLFVERYKGKNISVVAGEIWGGYAVMVCIVVVLLNGFEGHYGMEVTVVSESGILGLTMLS